MMDTELLTYNLGCGVEAFSTRRESVLPYPVIQGHQVHDCRIAIIDRPGLTREDLEGYDAFITALPGLAIGVRTADCVPILLYDPVRVVVAAIHAGWKGTVLHIVCRAIEAMTEQFGCLAADLRAVIGPAIGPDSFQVGEEVVERFRAAGCPMDSMWSFRGEGDGGPMSGGHHIDLWKANRWLLETSGVLPSNIQVAGIDTFTDTSFFSARREGPKCGRIINSIKLNDIMETNRILLRPWLENDAPALFKYASDPEVGSRAGWPPHKSVEESLGIIRTLFNNDSTWAIVLKETGEAIGAMGYGPSCECNLPAREGEPLIGYWVGRPYWDCGICTEALRLMLDFIRNNTDIASLISGHFIDNPASGRVMGKCGFIPTGETVIDPSQGSETPIRVLRLELKKN